MAWIYPAARYYYDWYEVPPPSPPVKPPDGTIKAAAEGRDLSATNLGSICTDPVATVNPDDPVEVAVRLMRERAVRRVVVTEQGDRPIGVVSLGDLARHRDPGSVLADVASAPPD